MKKTGTRRKIQFREKIDALLIAGILSYVISLLFRIPLTAMIGENGMGYFASVNELFMMITLFVSVGMAASVHSLIKYKMRREQYRGAQKVLRYALFMTIGFAAAVCILLLLWGDFVSDIVFLEPFSRMAVYMMAPSVLFMAVTCLLRGYFQGTGTKMPTIHSIIIEKLLTIGFGLFFAAVFYNYGKKVAAVLQNSNYAAVYGAMGAFAGILLASLLSFLHLFFIYLMYSGTVKRQMYKDNTKTVDTAEYVCRTLLWMAVPYGIFAVLFCINTLIDQRIYYYFMNVKNLGAGKAAAWGSYYGIYLVIVGVLAALGCLIPGRAVRGIVGAWNRDEQRSARDQVSQTINRIITATIPLAIFTAVLAEPLVEMLMKGNTSVATGLVQCGSSLIVFGVLGYLWISILKQLKHINKLLLIGLGTLGIHLGVLYLFLSQTELGINGVVLSNVISGLCVSVAGFAVVARMMRCQGELLRRCIRTLVVTLITAGVAGLIMLLLKVALLSLVGEIVCILICLLIAAPVYFLLMILLRGWSENDLLRIPGGEWIIRLVKRMHLL